MLVAVYEKESTSCLALHRTLTWLLTLAHNFGQFTCKTNHVYKKILCKDMENFILGN